MLNEFKKFIFKGNVIDLSTGVIIGAAFGAIVKAFSDGVVLPILNLFGGNTDVNLGFSIRGVYFDVGVVISAIISFLITAAVVFFVIIKPVNRLSEMLKKEEAKAPPPPPADVLLLAEIRDLLKAQGGKTSPTA
jgi:large conductance mechanosensitive channel